MNPQLISSQIVSRCAAFLQTLLPSNCPVCGEVPFDGTPGMFCANCIRQMEFTSPPFCPGCGGHLDGIFTVCSDCMDEPKRPWKGAFAPLRMNGEVKHVIHDYKYHGQAELARALGKLSASAIPEEITKRVDLIVPTPLHWTRYLWRGFNQSELLAEGVSQRTGIPCKNVICRVKRTKQQAKLSRDERMSNIHNAFFIKDSTILQKRAILLVDDVMTTGMTLSTETDLLLKAGASEVYVLVAARRQRN